MSIQSLLIQERVNEFNSYILSTELKKIKYQELEDYFLWLHSKGNKIPNTINSVILYCLGITDEKPIGDLKITKKGSMADIDLDIERGCRGNVINAITQWFGSDRVVPLITYSEMSSKRVIDDAGRVHGIEPAIRDRATSYIKVRQGKPDTLTVSLENSNELKELQKQYPDWFELAKNLESNIRHVGIHASGIVVAKDPIRTIMPLAFSSSKDLPTTQWDMSVIDEIGLTKVDILGLETLDIAHAILDTVRSLFKKKIDIGTLPLNDKDTWELIKAGKTLGIFQIESRMMRSMCRKVQPERLKDLMLISAIGRPGPMSAVQFNDTTLNQFVERKNSSTYQDYHPDLHDVLRGSYGLIVYQENVMEVSRILAGYNEVEQDILRKSIGKKNPEIFNKLKLDYKTRALARGYDEQLIDTIIDVSSTMAGYGFCAAHASAYSILTYVMAYLKTHYPTATFVSFFNSHSIQKKDKDERSKLPEFINDARYFGVLVKPPDINLSKLNTGIEAPQVIRLGIRSISGFRGNQKRLMDMQSKGPYKSIYDLIIRSGLDAGEIKALILAGACDSFIVAREHAIAQVDFIIDLVSKHKAKIKRQESNVQKYMLGGSYQSERIANGKKDDTQDKANKANIVLKQLLDYNLEVDIPEALGYTAISDEEKAKAEIDLLGLCLTINPWSKYEGVCKQYITASIVELMPDIDDYVDNSSKIIGGFIQGITLHLTKSGKQMAYVWLQDYSGSLEITIFPRDFERLKPLLVSGNSILVQGRMNEDEDFLVTDMVSAEEVSRTNKCTLGRKFKKRWN